MEGTSCFRPGCGQPDFRFPVIDYPHNEGCAITGGFVYRGSLIPEIQGHYFYSDWCTGFLRSFVFAGGAAVQRTNWTVPSPGNVTSFGNDSSGELYVLTQQGFVFRIVRQ